MDEIVDFITGKKTPNIGAQANRQKVERFLVEKCGYDKADIQVEKPVALTIAGENYRSNVDIIVQVAGENAILIKCVAGSLGSREREVVAAARVIAQLPVPVAVVSDGNTAVVLDSITGKKTGEGLGAIHGKEAMGKLLGRITGSPYPKARLEREKILFRSFDSDNVNVTRT